MLRPQDFSVSFFGEAVGLSLALPRGKYDDCAIIAPAGEGLTAVTLEGDNPFMSFNCTNNTSWKGVLIPNISIEIDETSIFDPEDGGAPLGSLVRATSTLAIVSVSEGGFRRQARVPLVAGLPLCAENFTAGFRRWKILIGEGLSRQELKAIGPLS